MNRIVTSCKECKFAIYTKNSQTSCEFNLLNKYKDAGINIIEAYDNEKEFFVVDRICMYSRHTSSSNNKEDVLRAIEANYQVIYILNSDDIEYFSLCLESIINQSIRPKHITVIKPFDIDIKPFHITKLLTRSNIGWRYQETTNPELSENDLIDIAIDIVAHPYYVVLRSVHMPDKFSEELNTLVNQKFTIFSYLHGKSIYLVPTIHHKQLGGNSFKPLLDKIQEDEHLSKKIFEIGDLIPCISY